MVLTSAIYFKGSWISPFKQQNTHDQDFWIAPQKGITTPMMSQTIEVPYAEYDDLQVVSLPYRHDTGRQNSEISMVILLPRAHDGLDKVSAQLVPRKLEEWINGLQLRDVEVFLPSFKIESFYNLREPLSELGMRNAFDSANADFTGMAQTDEPFWIEQLIQKAYVHVNEEGTEAAAACIDVMFGASGSPPRIPVFRADHPFLFFIRHNQSGTILFVGGVNDPQAQS